MWNWALETRTKAYKESKESLNYSILNRQLTALKQTACPWLLAKPPPVALPKKLKEQDTAFRNFFSGRARYHRFKSHHHTPSVRYQLDQRHVAKKFNAESTRLILPKLGALKLKWSCEVGGIPKVVTVNKDPAGRYFVSMACEVEMNGLLARRNAFGVDAA